MKVSGLCGIERYDEDRAKYVEELVSTPLVQQVCSDIISAGLIGRLNTDSSISSSAKS